MRKNIRHSSETLWLLHTLIQEEWLVPFNNIHDNKVSRMGILFRSSADEIPKHTHKTVYSCSTNYKVETDKEGGVYTRLHIEDSHEDARYHTTPIFFIDWL